MTHSIKLRYGRRNIVEILRQVPLTHSISMSRSKVRPHRYTVEFRRQAAEQVLLQHRYITQIARQLNCSPQSVTNWIGQFRDQIPSTTFLILSNQYLTSSKSKPKPTDFSSSRPKPSSAICGLLLRASLQTSNFLFCMYRNILAVIAMCIIATLFSEFRS